MSIIQNNKVFDKFERDLDVSTEVKLGEQEVEKGRGRPTDAEYGAYCAAFFNGLEFEHNAIDWTRGILLRFTEPFRERRVCKAR
eukprot:11045352-Alexandrium_andersonii.AAC.1